MNENRKDMMTQKKRKRNIKGNEVKIATWNYHLPLISGEDISGTIRRGFLSLGKVKIKAAEFTLSGTKTLP